MQAAAAAAARPHSEIRLNKQECGNRDDPGVAHGQVDVWQASGSRLGCNTIKARNARTRQKSQTPTYIPVLGTLRLFDTHPQRSGAWFIFTRHRSRPASAHQWEDAALWRNILFAQRSNTKKRNSLCVNYADCCMCNYTVTTNSLWLMTQTLSEQNQSSFAKSPPVISQTLSHHFVCVCVALQPGDSVFTTETRGKTGKGQKPS